MRAKANQGLTVLEVLLAAAVLVILLGALAGVLASVRRSYQVTERTTREQETAELASQILHYDIRLAGYRGIDNEVESRNFSGPTLVVQEGDSDSISVRYFEDRFTGGEVTEQAVTFDVTGGHLRRNGEAVVEGVTRLKVVEYVHRDGERSTTKPPLNELAALALELEFTSGQARDVLIALANRLE